MGFRKHVIFSTALLCLSGLLIGCSSDETTTAPTITSEAPMLPPTNVIINRLPNGDVRLTWDANTQPHWRGYNVYRAITGGGAIGRVNPSLISTNSYTDVTTDGRSIYEYFVTSVSAKSAESGFSIAVVFDSREHESKRDREN